MYCKMLLCIRSLAEYWLFFSALKLGTMLPCWVRTTMSACERHRNLYVWAIKYHHSIFVSDISIIIFICLFSTLLKVTFRYFALQRTVWQPQFWVRMGFSVQVSVCSGSLQTRKLSKRETRRFSMTIGQLPFAVDNVFISVSVPGIHFAWHWIGKDPTGSTVYFHEFRRFWKQ